MAGLVRHRIGSDPIGATLLDFILTILLLWRSVLPLVSSDPQTAVPIQPEPVPAPAPCHGVRCWLIEAGWPAEWLTDGERVALCESSGRPDARNGIYRGLFQLSPLWFRFAGEDGERWDDPVINARTALAVVRYDLSRGLPMWNQWQCQP